MTRILWTCWALSVVLLWVGCDAKPPVGGSAATTPAVQSPVKIVPVSDAQAKTFADALVMTVQAESGADQQIDWDSLLNRASSGLNMNPKSLAAFNGGVKKGVSLNGLVPQIRAAVKQGGSYKHLRTHQTAEGTRVTMRLIMAEGGMNYHDYLLQDVNGRVNAVDINIAATGEDMSQTFRRLMIPLIAHDNRGVLDRLSGKEGLLVKHLGDMEKAVKCLQEGQHQQALQTLNSLPMELQNEKFFLVLQIAAAQGANDEAATQRVIERMRAQYPSDPATALFSLDYYFVNKDYSKTIATLKQLDQSVGGDANLWCMMAGILLQTKDIPGAKAAVEKAISMEPDLLTCYWNRVAIAVEEEDNATILKTMQYIHDDLSVTLDANSIRSEPTYSKFILSPEFKELEKLLAE